MGFISLCEGWWYIEMDVVIAVVLLWINCMGKAFKLKAATRFSCKKKEPCFNVEAYDWEVFFSPFFWFFFSLVSRMDYSCNHLPHRVLYPDE